MSYSKTALSVCEAQDFHMSMQSKPAKDNKHINSVKHIELVHGSLAFADFSKAVSSLPRLKSLCCLQTRHCS